MHLFSRSTPCLALCFLACGIESSNNTDDAPIIPIDINQVSSESETLEIHTEDPIVTDPMRPTVLSTRLVPVDVNEAEDGYGGRIQTLNPIAVEVEATRWPGRALDPVLVIGERQFYHYSHPGPGRIRYILADTRWASASAEWHIEYGTNIEPIRIPTPLQTE